MEQSKDRGTVAANSFVPLIPRLNRIDRLIRLLEEKHTLSRIDFLESDACNNNSNIEAMEKEDECQTKKISMSSALEEIQHKGSLVDRLASLENRLLQLCMDIDVGNTSKSSSSTVQLASETTGNGFVDGNQMLNNNDNRGHQTWEKDGRVGKTTSARSERKQRKKWLLRLFQVRLTC